MITLVALTVIAFAVVAGGLWLTNYVYTRTRATQFKAYEAATPSRPRCMGTSVPHLQVIHGPSD